MKTERRPVYVARDKTEHQTEDACLQHEWTLDCKLIGDADETEIVNAFKGGAPAVLDALERLGLEARDYRKANGGAKRKIHRDAPQPRERERRTATA